MIFGFKMKDNSESFAASGMQWVKHPGVVPASELTLWKPLLWWRTGRNTPGSSVISSISANSDPGRSASHGGERVGSFQALWSRWKWIHQPGGVGRGADDRLDSDSFESISTKNGMMKPPKFNSSALRPGWLLNNRWAHVYPQTAGCLAPEF